MTEPAARDASAEDGRALPSRAFVALYPPADALDAIDATTRRLRDALGDAFRWAAPASVHLTLRFLGELPHAALEHLGSALAAVAGRHAPLDLTLAGAGAFPPRGAPRVVWIGTEPSPALAALQADVEAACAAAGLPRERRPFRAHFTVGRARTGAQPPAAATAAALAAVGLVAAARLTSLHLMLSRLAPAGATHSPFGTYPLLGRAPRDRGAR